MHRYRFLLALVMLALPRAAVARQPAVAPAPPAPVAPAPQALEGERPEPKRRWYGGQTLAADGISLGVLVLGAANENFAYVGVGGLFLAAPIVHFGHGNVGRGFLSLGMRVALPIGGAALGSASEGCGGGGEQDFCGLAGAAIGLLVGGVAAIALDSAVVAWEPVPKETRAVSWSPGLIATKDSARLLVSGSF
ncbi:MAG TPA: hypothetical protein VJN18_33460 [Polyangiaceae bacterium]|nr:hypothetical protein [Polyangiaceae bacterium]